MSEQIPFGEAMRALRLHLGMNQQAFAAKLGWSAQYVSRVELGQHVPTVATLMLIGERTGVPASRIIKNVERRKKLLRSRE